MSRSTLFIRTFALVALLAARASFGAANAPSNTAAKPELRFEQEMQAFADADRTKPPIPGGILFVGSSIFRQWTNVAEMMAPLPVLNRAFGGSRTGDQLARFDQVVMPHAPKVIVYYCGSNDLNAKPADAPEAIFERFRAFSERVRAALPATRLIYVTATRSPDRVARWEQVDHYNALVRAYCEATPHHTFVDINPALVDDQGRPRLELYQADKLHFHPPAYAEFAAIIKPVLMRVWAEVASSSATPSARQPSEMQTLPANGRLSATASNEANWSQFRGPNGAGVANSFKPPVRIIADQAAWKTPLPPGKSSPVLWNGRIFLTGVESNRLATLALDSKSGKILWKKLAPQVRLDSVHAANSAAASTPCVDAERVYVYFGSYGLLCYDHDGRELWQQAISKPQSMYGVSTSPILHERRLILVVDDDANLPDSKLSRSKVVALDKATGEKIWETPRPHNRSGWSTPMIWQHERGTDLVVLGNGRVCGYDPATGAEKWYVTGFAREPVAVPVAGNGQLFVSVAMQGGRGDVQLDPEPFWAALLPLDRNGDGKIGRDEITENFTLPFRPELPLGHPGFGMPLPSDPAKRKESQIRIFDLRDKNHDGLWTKEEFAAEMTAGHGQPNLAAILPGGTGDVTATHVKWNLRNGIPEIPSPIFHSNRLYLVRDGGTLSCVNSTTGEVIYRERLGAAGQYMASPVLADGHLYLVSSKGVITVVKCGDKFEILPQADLKASIAATPAFDQHSLYVRADDAVLAFR